MPVDATIFDLKKKKNKIYRKTLEDITIFYQIQYYPIEQHYIRVNMYNVNMRPCIYIYKYLKNDNRILLGT